MERVAAWLGLLLVCLAGCQPPSTRQARIPVAEFATSLEGRTRGQVHNAVLCAKRLHKARIAPGSTWSFNHAVGQWVRSAGYVRAPVSYGGILVPAWGGGVCQTATTLYNAALLSGLEVVERHAHTVAPSYVPPGRDAAVAHGIADLRIRNPYSFPCQIEFSKRGTQLVCTIVALAPPEQVRKQVVQCILQVELLSSSPAPTVRGFKPQQGRAGMRVRLWRVCKRGSEIWRELCHETQYAPLPKSVPNP